MTGQAGQFSVVQLYNSVSSAALQIASGAFAAKARDNSPFSRELKKAPQAITYPGTYKESGKAKGTPTLTPQATKTTINQ